MQNNHLEDASLIVAQQILNLIRESGINSLCAVAALQAAGAAVTASTDISRASEDEAETTVDSAS